MAKILKSKHMNKCLGCFCCQRVCSATNQRDYCDLRSAIRIRSLGGLHSGNVAIHCLACKGERACVEVCPTHALENRAGGGVILHKELCIGCKRCEPACIVRAIHFTSGIPYPVVCRHCGVCTKFCPHKCLAMEESSNVE
jgi:Fe-S-cluster-containing dehydrogenase component